MSVFNIVISMFDLITSMFDLVMFMFDLITSMFDLACCVVGYMEDKSSSSSGAYP